MDIEWLLSTLFDASLLSLEPPETAALFLRAEMGPFCPISVQVGMRATPGNYVGIFPQRPLYAIPSPRLCSLLTTGEAYMSEHSVQDRDIEPVSFQERLAGSQAFAALFRDGMALVEETAAYLDGKGRQESKVLDRAAALAYATESMRLTTRLMQLASWLLLHRAVKEGEMSLAQVNQEKTKVKLSVGAPITDETLALLPPSLTDLIARSRKLHDHVVRLDSTIHNKSSDAPAQGGNPVERQLGLLKAAFEQRGA